MDISNESGQRNVLPRLYTRFDLRVNIKQTGPAINIAVVR
jgi:hypothetical protein